MNNLIDTKQFNLIDQLILQDNINSVKQETVEFSFNPRSWYYDSKIDSTVLNLLYKNENLFKQVNISVDMVVIVLCSLYNYKNYIRSKGFFLVNDRILAKRCYLSRETLYDIIYILGGLNILEISYELSNIKVKLNENLLRSDNYFQLKCEKFYKHDMEVIINIEEQYSTHYYNAYSKRTSYNQLKEIILGTTLVYNSYIMNKGEYFYKLRQDGIIYVEIPVHLISRITHISEKHIMKYISKLYRNTNYISKHDKVYCDFKLEPNKKCFTNLEKYEHYTNELYKLFPLNKYTKMNNKQGYSYEITHPKVTEYSAFIYLNNFINTKIGVKVLNNISKYNRIITTHLRFNQLDNILYSKYVNVEQLNEQESFTNLFESHYNDKPLIDKNLYNDIQEYLTSDNGYSQYNIKKLKYAQKVDEFTKNHKRLKLYGDIQTKNIESLSKYVKSILNQVAAGSTNNFKYYINEVNNIINDHIPNILTNMWKEFSNSNRNKLLGNKLYRAYEVLQHYKLYGFIINKYKNNVLQTNEFRNKYTTNQINYLLDMSVYSNITEQPDCTDIYENGKNIFDNIVLL